MATVRTCVKALALLPIFGRAQGVEDAAALIQVVQPVELSTESALPSANSELIRMTRLSASAEANSLITLNYTAACEEFDEFGPKECALYYSTPFDSTFTVSLNGGIDSGDKIKTTMAASFDRNLSNPLAWFFPAQLGFNATCSICQDSCTLTGTGVKTTLSATFPSPIDDPDICTVEQNDFTIAGADNFWVKPPAVLGLKGNWTVGMGLYDSSDNVRVAAEYIYKLDSTASPSAAMLNKVRHEEQRPRTGMLKSLIESIGFGFVEDIQAMVSNSSSTKAAKAKRKEGSSTHHMFTNFTVLGAASGNSVSLTADMGCTATDSSGSVYCEGAMGTTPTFSYSISNSWTAMEAGTLYQSSKLHLGGNLGALLEALMGKKEMTLPLCGREAVDVVDLHGKNVSYVPPKCGDYSIDFSSSEIQFPPLPDFENFDLPEVEGLPGLPKTLDELLPISKTVEIMMKNPDGSHILSVELTLGMKLG